MERLKSLISLLLLFGFLSSVTGINVYKHYCGDFLADISFFIKSNPCADENGEDSCSVGKDVSCCEDETEFYQLDTELFKQQSSTEKYEMQPVEVELRYVLAVTQELEKKTHQELDPPPPKYQNPLYQQFQQLIFYG